MCWIRVQIKNITFFLLAKNDLFLIFFFSCCSWIVFFKKKTYTFYIEYMRSNTHLRNTLVHTMNACNLTTYSTLLNNLFIAVYFIMTWCQCLTLLAIYMHIAHNTSTWIRVSCIASLHNSSSLVLYAKSFHEKSLIREFCMWACLCFFFLLLYNIFFIGITSIQYTSKVVFR